MESDEETRDTREDYSGEEEPAATTADEENYVEETRETLSSPLEEVPSDNEVATEQIDEEEVKDDADKTDPPLATPASNSPSLSPEPSPPPSPSKSPSVSPEPQLPPEPSPPKSPSVSPEPREPSPHSPSPSPDESPADEAQHAQPDEPSAAIEQLSLSEPQQMELDQSNTVEAEDQQHDTTPPSSPPPPSSTPSQSTTVEKKVVPRKSNPTQTPGKDKTTPAKGKTTTPVKGKTVPVKYKTPVKTNDSATPERTGNSSSGKKRSSGKKAFQPTQVKPFNFSTDRRVEQRQKYDERRNKMQKAQEERERLESKRREKEEAEALKEYRKSLIIKARPIQYYTPITVAPSSKPPTLPEGPVLTTMCRSRAADQKSPNATSNKHPTEYL